MIQFRIFKQGADIRNYQEQLNKLNIMLQLKSLKVRSVLAYILLFDITDDDSSDFQSRRNVNMDDLHILNQIMFQNCKLENTDNFAIQDFARTLREMSNFFFENVSWREFELTATLPFEPYLKVCRMFRIGITYS
jgi:hypothetical protein